MSAGNACAMIGLANSNKIPAIGAYVQDTGLNLAGTTLSGPGPSADGPYIGCSGSDVGANGLNTGTYWNWNVIGELVNPAYTVPANSGAATGKTASWVWNSASALTVPADGRIAVSSGVATAASGSGAYKTYIAAGTVIPAGSYFWVFLI